MSKIKTIIVDDEPAALNAIHHLAKLTTDVSVERTLTNGIDAIQAIIELKPDVIFLDINMPHLNGFDVIAKTPSFSAEVIFITGSEDFAIQAFRVDAVDYLLKPIDPVAFFVAMEKTRTRLKSKKEFFSQHPASKKIQLPTQDGILFLEEKNIIHVTSKGSYSLITPADVMLKKILASKNIGQFEQKLSGRFFRCHNSHLINLDYVISFSTNCGTYVTMTNGDKIEVSRRNKAELLAKLSQLTSC
jgi:two-component system, LytTR family, response regulator